MCTEMRKAMTADLYYETARKLVLKDKREVFVRQLNAGDAEAMLVYLQKTVPVAA